MLDETIITETPPLYARYGKVGQQAELPITGNRAKRILHGVINVKTGDVLLAITPEWDAETQQAFLRMVRHPWRGWHMVLFEDKGAPHTAGESRQLTRELNIEVRWLPRATPELNAMDQLWKHVKRDALANRPTRSIEASADAACRHILQMRGQERLRRAGVLSGNFWLRA